VVNMAVLGLQLYSMILKVFSNLKYSVIPESCSSGLALSSVP